MFLARCRDVVDQIRLNWSNSEDGFTIERLHILFPVVRVTVLDK